MVENDSLMREVDEAVRHDRLMQLWNQFKMPLIYASIALIVVTAGSSIWNSYQRSQAEETTYAFEAARQLYIAQRYEESAKAFDLLTHQTRGEMADMAKLWRARALLAVDKNKTAMRVLQNIILAPEGRNLFWRDLACLHVMGLVKSVSEVPENCSGKHPSPLASTLTQFRAAGLWSEGDTEGAKKLLENILQNENTSMAAKAEARSWSATIQAYGKKE